MLYAVNAHPELTCRSPQEKSLSLPKEEPGESWADWAYNCAGPSKSHFSYPLFIHIQQQTRPQGDFSFIQLRASLSQASLQQPLAHTRTFRWPPKQIKTLLTSQDEFQSPQLTRALSLLVHTSLLKQQFQSYGEKSARHLPLRCNTRVWSWITGISIDNA